MRVDAAAAALRTPGPLTVTALIWPTFAATREQCVISRWDETAQVGWALSLGPGGVTARVGARERHPDHRRHPPGPSPAAVAADLARGRSGRGHAARRARSAHRRRPGGRVGAATAGGPARRGRAAADRRAARPRGARALQRQDRGSPAARRRRRPRPRRWCSIPCCRPMASSRAGTSRRASMGSTSTDVGPHRLGGRLVNLPTRAVTGARWTGREMCWRHAPREYAAIHFHDDDVYDAGWATDFELTIPDDLPSGAYLMRLSAEGHADDLPFYVRPPRGRPRADVLLHRVHLHVPGLRQPRARLHRRRVPRARRRVGRLSPHPGQPSGLRLVHLQPAPGRQRHLLLIAPAPRADVPAPLPHLLRRPRLGPAPLLGGHPPARLARGAGHPVRRRHRRGRGGRGRGPARPVRDRAHRLAPRVPHRAHARRPRGLSGRRRPAGLPGRQRLLLAHRHQPRGARRHRGAARRGRHPRVGRPDRRVLSRARRRLRRPLAPQRASAAADRRGRLLRRKGSSRARTIAASPARTTRRRPGSWRASRTR